MDTENLLSLPIHAKEPFRSPLISGAMSGLAPIGFAFVVSTGCMLLLGVAPTTSDPIFNPLLLFMASLTFFLAAIQLPLFPIINSTGSLGSIAVTLVKHLPFASLVTSLNTMTLALLTMNELPNWIVLWVIQSELVCFTIAVLCKLIANTFVSSCRHYLRVAFLTICIGFSGLYTCPSFYLPGTIQDNSIHHGINCLYHFALVPVAFVLGTILVIISITPPGDLSIPFVSALFKERLVILTLAVGLTTLVIGGFLRIYAVCGNLAMPGGFGVGEAIEAAYVRIM